MATFIFDHVHLRSLDAMKTADFYAQMFGAKLVGTGKQPNGLIRAKMDLNGTTILINEVKKGEPTGLVHFGVRTENLKESIATFKKKGVKFTQEMTEIRSDFHMSFMTAPDDVSIELQEGSL
jgi:hypothetical protein